jgi:hypothetical protein
LAVLEFGVEATGERLHTHGTVDVKVNHFLEGSSAQTRRETENMKEGCHEAAGSNVQREFCKEQEDT